MRRLCFGGSFNPIHHGHLICARFLAETAGFDRVVLIPSAHPPHKPRVSDLAPAEHRLAMCRLAAESEPRLFEVEDLELRRTGPSYTIDTARQLKQRSWDPLYWLVGADMLLQLPGWYQPEALMAEVHFMVMARPGWTLDWSSLPPAYRHLQHHVVTTPLIDISATDIRRRLKAGRSIAYLTVPSVITYIESHHLYQSKPIS